MRRGLQDLCGGMRQRPGRDYEAVRGEMPCLRSTLSKLWQDEPLVCARDKLEKDIRRHPGQTLLLAKPVNCFNGISPPLRVALAEAGRCPPGGSGGRREPHTCPRGRFRAL